jgi:hypothetical protein
MQVRGQSLIKQHFGQFSNRTINAKGERLAPLPSFFSIARLQ